MEARRSTGSGWRKSSASGNSGCVEITFSQRDLVLVRDSKAPNGPVLRFNAVEWDAFLAGVRAGEFDGDWGP